MTTMTETNTLRIFRPPIAHASAHIASNVPHWVNQFNQLCESQKEHRRSLKELCQINDMYCKPYVFSEKNTVVQKSLDMIQNDIKDLQERRKEDMRKFQESQRAFNDLRTAFREAAHKVKPDVKLQILYAKVREKLDQQTAAVNASKKNYHNVMFKIERASVKSKLATRPSVVLKAEKKMKHCNEKSKTFAEKYKDELVEWRKQSETLSKVAADLEANFIETESVRANLIIGNLVACFNNERTGLKSDDDSDMLFRGISGQELISDVVKLLTETIIIPVFEQYTPGATDDTYANAKRDLLVDDYDVDIDDGDSDLDKMSDTEFKHAIHMNRQLKKLRKSQVFIVTEEYEKRRPSEINLIVGERVKQLLPANGEGYSFGEVTHGKLRKKKKGFYPDCHVSLIELLESDDDDDNAKNYRKEIVKRVVARAKAKSVEADNEKLDEETTVDTDSQIEKDVSAYGFSDLDANDESDCGNKKVHKKSKFRRLISAVKPKKKDTGKCHTYNDEISVEECTANEDILHLYKKKGRVEKFVKAFITTSKDEKDATDGKYKKCKLEKWLTGEKHHKTNTDKTGSKTMVVSFGEDKEIENTQEEIPKKKSKRFSKLAKLFKRNKKDHQSVAVEGENETENEDEFQFMMREPKLFKAPTNDFTQEFTDVIDVDEEDFGYVDIFEASCSSRRF